MIATLPDITVGATVNYQLTLPDYPAGNGWVVTVYLNGATTTYSVICGTSGDTHLFQVAAATTGAWVAGSYAWQAWAALGTDRYPAGKGQLQLLPGLIGAPAGTDTRSQAQRALDDCLIARAAWNPAVQSYRIAGREMTFRSRDEIDGEITFWEKKVKQEYVDAVLSSGRPNPRKLQVRMGRA